MVLGGGGLNSETVWCTVNGDWDNFYDLEGSIEPAPSHAIEFTTTFRDPIKWLLGQKVFMIGGESLEYKVESQSGLLQPADIDARVQTTQGSKNVQPVGLGDEVLFPAEAGRKLRSLRYFDEKDGYVATDLTLFNPFIVSSGIRRMARIRNPHQMMVAVLENGIAALFHYEPNIGLQGWSRIVTQGKYVDVTVAKDRSGLDVPVFVVQRTIGGVKRLHVEVIPRFTQAAEWQYTDSWVGYDNVGGGNVLTGLDHLEGERVQVVGDGAFIGEFTVSGGSVVLIDGEGFPITPVTAAAGLLKGAVMETLPPVVDQTSTGGVGAKKRYSNIALRLRNSRPPLINGQRPPDKYEGTTMDQGEPLVPLQDVDVANLGHSIYAPVIIAEVLPFRSEVVGIYTKLSSNKL